MRLFEDYELEAMIEKEQEEMRKVRRRTKQRQQKEVWAKCFRIAVFAWILFTILVLLLHLVGKLPETNEKSTTEILQNTMADAENNSLEDEKSNGNASDGSVEVLSDGSKELPTTLIQSLQYTSDSGSITGDNVPATEYASLEAKETEYEHSATFTVTYYCGCSECCGKWTGNSESNAMGAFGTKLTPYYSIAVSPDIIPLGSIVETVDGTTYKAEDTGSAIKGYRIDVFTGSHEEARKLGVNEIILYW